MVSLSTAMRLTRPSRAAQILRQDGSGGRLAYLFTQGDRNQYALYAVFDATRYSLLRLANTAVGIVVGMTVSFLAWPVRGGDALERAVREVLAACAEVLGAIRDGTLAAATPAQRRVLDGIGTALKALADAWRVPLSHESSRALGERCRSAIEAGLYAVSASVTLARIDPSPATATALASRVRAQRSTPRASD